MKATKAPASRQPVKAHSRSHTPTKTDAGGRGKPAAGRAGAGTKEVREAKVKGEVKTKGTKETPGAPSKGAAAGGAGVPSVSGKGRVKGEDKAVVKGAEKKRAVVAAKKVVKPAAAGVKAKAVKNAVWFEESSKTPRQARFRMPAEWETHYGTFLTWPNRKGISFPGKGAYEAVLPAFESMLHALVASEQVFINVASEEDRQTIRDLLTIAEQSRVHFLEMPCMEPWCRDHGATFVVRGEDRGGGSVVWKFNSWGQKYDKAAVDAGIGRRMAEYLGGKIFQPGMVMEGGAIEVNGSGTVLTTESCLLNKNRNRGVKREDMERLLKDYLGVTQVLWLPGGLEGDDTDGHIDTITRFTNRTTVVTCVEENPKDRNHAVLSRNLELLKEMKVEDGTPLTVVPLPMPQPIVRKGQRMPATYANFYIGNKVVLLPQYDDPADEKALEIMVKSFPTRRIYPIDCRELIWGLGAFHCLTQQLPLAAFPKVVDLIRNPPPAPRPVY